MIKLIATDLDGTLLMPDHVTVSLENTEALREASERGIKTVIASGRTYGVFSNDVRRLGFIDYAIMSNGASLMAFDTATGEPTTHSPVTELPFDVWEKVYTAMSDAGADPEIYAFGKSFMDEGRRSRYASDRLPEELVAELFSHISFVDDVREVLRGRSIEKICSLSVPESTRGALEAALYGNESLSVTTSIPGNIEVNYRGTSKGAALEMLCGLLDIKPSEVMVFGDADNDIEMLKFAEYSFAMGNASPEVKAVARYTALPNTEHGVADAIRKYALT